MKKIALVLLVALIAMGTVFATGSAEAPKAQETMKIAICLGTGGLGDKNFNDMAYAGLTQAAEDFGITFDYYEPKTVSDYAPALRHFADTEEYALIIGMGSDMDSTMAEVAVEYPNQKFSLVDTGNTNPPANLRTVATRWQEQTFLCGVYAGLGTLSDMPNANSANVIGVILGMDTPVLRNGVTGFITGARYVNKDVEVLEAVIGSFNDAPKGKEVAISMFNRGADFIQPIAGACGLGVFNGAKENGFYAFGVGGNQNHIEPSVVLATSIRNVNEMIYNEVAAVVNG
ncbi:MAG: BMP family ABC transporter substrate-binding protein, partial [Sphaerochaetaceae bacterium]|nr:BMP family ABC transporter substrate-binding protein [Sphaerochaetaceae bacterium]